MAPDGGGGGGGVIRSSVFFLQETKNNVADSKRIYPKDGFMRRR